MLPSSEHWDKMHLNSLLCSLALNKHYGVQQRAVDPKKGWKCNFTRLIGRKWSEGCKMTHFCCFKSGFWLSDGMQKLHVACNAMQNIYQLQAGHSTFSQKFYTWTHVRLVRFHLLIFHRPWAHFKSPIGNPNWLIKTEHPKNYFLYPPLLTPKNPQLKNNSCSG